MAEVLVVGSKMKAYIKSQGCMTSSELLEALSAKVEKMLSEACGRAKANKRSTIKPQDL